MELADQWGCTNLIFEFDCLEIIQTCKGEVDTLNPYSIILTAQGKGIRWHASLLGPRVIYGSNFVISWAGDPPQSILVELVSDVTII